MNQEEGIKKIELMIHLEFRKKIDMAWIDSDAIPTFKPTRISRKRYADSFTSSTIPTTSSTITMDEWLITRVILRATLLNNKSIVTISKQSRIRFDSIFDHFIDICRANARC